MRVLGGLIGAAFALALTACSPGGGAPDGVVLTISGAINESNRGGLDTREDVLLNWLGADFDAGLALSAADLAGLHQITVETDYPAGGPMRSFSGPRLADVLDLAGARGEGDTLTAMALDGYAADIPYALVESYDVILATHRDGEALALGGFGPAQIVFPRQNEPVFEGMDDSLWVWGVVWIDVQAE